MDDQAPNQQPAKPSAEPTNGAQLEPVPSQWPGAFGLFQYSKAAVMVNIWSMVGLWVGVFIVSAVCSGYDRPGKGEAPSAGYLSAQLISFVISMWFSAASAIIGMTSVKRQKIDAVDALRKAVPYLLSFLALGLITSVISLASLLLIIPFFFIVPRIVLAPYYLLDQKMGVTDALQASWNGTKGHVGKIFGIIGASLAMALLIVTIIGIPIALYLLVMYSFAEVILYYFIKEQSIPAVQPTPESNAGPTPPTSI